MKTNRFMLTTTAAALLAVGTIAAQASPLVLSINNATCVDQAACDASATVGFISWTVPSAVLAGTGYSVMVETGQSYPLLGSAALPVLRLNTTVTSDGTGTSNSAPLTIRATQTGFTVSGAALFDLSSTVNFPTLAEASAPLATSVYSYFLDNNNAAFGTTTLLGGNTFTYTDPLNTAQSFNTVVPGIPDGDFSMTTQIVLNGIDANRGVAASAAVNTRQAVPEPNSLALLGIAMLGLGLVRRRRPKQG